MKTQSATPAPAKAAAPKKSSGGLNPVFVIPILFIIAELVFHFIFGDGKHFQDGDNTKLPLPGDYFGTVYAGGFIVPILFTCFLCVFVFSIERFITIGRANGSGSIDDFVRKVKSQLDRNEVSAAIAECDKQKGSIGNVVKTALLKYQQLATDTQLNKEQKLVALQKEVEEATTLELPMLEKNLTIIATLASVSTLIALLGTVLGMIRAFAAMGATGQPDTGALSTGISEALVNTAIGIGTAAIATIMYSYFTSRIDTLTYNIDEIGLSIQQNFAAHN
ncbi:MotA/TolQ/ExbB proton channel family protein [Fibrivirga algicola]|uniref:MotA/TolQ/ExbB proton channel family protein n=1 Tax=Fibrivirga algicola TaxID=2950420 RepID=A0ABX0QHT3_9BACT|nr:MotA/TolQ/ExbB proton channel family protein [Fibrivirga algicola]ARK10472.1 flagellar motor protein MotA [Fibrella sp. ES10-3-2-2]NID11975.1 MotA/TolQ/ExbB proton channel family protein [Fibrivirga algicola]